MSTKTNKRIDQLPSNANTVKGSDILPIFSDNRTERTTIDELGSYLGVSLNIINDEGPRVLSNADVTTNAFIRMTGSTATTLLVLDDTVLDEVSLGNTVSVSQTGVGQITISGGTGVTLQSTDGSTKTRTQHSTASLLKVADNTWLITGDITI
jgi:hypothetical protein